MGAGAREEPEKAVASVVGSCARVMESLSRALQARSSIRAMRPTRELFPGRDEYTERLRLSRAEMIRIVGIRIEYEAHESACCFTDGGWDEFSRRSKFWSQPNKRRKSGRHPMHHATAYAHSYREDGDRSSGLP